MRNAEEFKELIMSKCAEKRRRREEKKQIVMKSSAFFVMFVLVVSTFLWMPRLIDESQVSTSFNSMGGKDDETMVDSKTTAVTTTTVPMTAYLTVLFGGKRYYSYSKSDSQQILELLEEYDGMLIDKTKENNVQTEALYCFYIYDCKYGNCFFDGEKTLYNSSATVTLSESNAEQLTALLRRATNQ